MEKKTLNKRLRVLWASLPFLLSVSMQLTAQPYLTRHFSNQHGLAQSQVQAIFQDTNGYIWFGTHGGVSRFDGIHFSNYSIDDGLISNSVLNFVEDSWGRLWIGTKNGISIFNGTSFTPIEDSFSSKEHDSEFLSVSINDMLRTTGGSIWIASRSGLSNFDNNTFFHVTTKDGLPSTSVTALAADQKGNIWMGTLNGVCVLRAVKLNCYSTKEGLPASTIKDVLVDYKGYVWAATPAGLAVMDPARENRFRRAEQIPTVVTNVLMEDRAKALWIGTQNGIIRLDSTGSVVEKWRDTGWIVSSFFQDRENTVWAGTSGRGAYQFQRTAFTHVNPALDLPQDVYLAIYSDSSNVIWAGTLSNGLFRIEGKKIRHFPIKRHPALQHIRYIAQDTSGILMIGGAKGVARFDGVEFQTVQFRNASSIPYIYSYNQDKEGNLWIATTSGLYRSQGDSLISIDLGYGPASTSVYSLYTDRDRIWLSTSDGLMFYRNGTVHPVEALAKRSVTTIAKDNRGYLWLGTQGHGVIRLNPQNEQVVDTITVSDGLNSGTVFFTLFDQGGHLWVGTNMGVNRLDMDVYRFSGSKNVRAYGLHDGLVGIETNLNAASIDQKGGLWFGTIEGLMNYDAVTRPVNTKPPLVHLTGIRLFMEPTTPVFPENSLIPTFQHEKNHLTFDFEGLSFISSEQLRYEYRLHGFDTDWSIPTASRYVTYSNLAPGPYTFEVKAKNSDGVLSSRPAMFSFEITPPYWQTNWFKLLVALGGILLVFGIVQLRTHALNKRKNLLEEMVDERTKDLERTHSELLEAREASLAAAKSKSAFLSTMTHELRTPMNGILGMTELLAFTEMTEEQVDYTETILKCSSSLMDLIEDLLTFADLAAGRRTVALEEIYLPDLLAENLVAIRSEAQAKTLETRCFLAPVVPHTVKADREHLNRILNHLLSNAVKFTQEGLVFVEVQIHRLPAMSSEGHELLFSVHDTGIGMDSRQLESVFDAFSQADMSASRSFQGSGIGLALAHQMSLLMDGRLAAESWPGVGSTFHLALPLQSEAPALLSEINAGPLAGKRVRIAVESRRERRRLALLCRSMGMHVDEAVEQRNVDIVIADLAHAKQLSIHSSAVLVPFASPERGSEGTVILPGAPGREVERVLHAMTAERLTG